MELQHAKAWCTKHSNLCQSCVWQVLITLRIWRYFTCLQIEVVECACVEFVRSLQLVVFLVYLPWPFWGTWLTWWRNSSDSFEDQDCDLTTLLNLCITELVHVPATSERVFKSLNSNKQYLLHISYKVSKGVCCGVGAGVTKVCWCLF